MANPVCLSPLKFYDSFYKQNHRKSYAHGNISPLLTKTNWIPPFQFVIPNDLYDTLGRAYLVDAQTDTRVTNNIASNLIELGFTIIEVDGFKVAVFNGNLPFSFNREGLFYLNLISIHNTWEYYSEVFSFTSSIEGCTEIEYWNSNDNFYIKNGIVTFPANFHFKLLLQTEIGKPEYSFEEESTKRLGYSFIESQVSKKVHKFNAVLPEFICDAMRIIRLCDNRIIRNNDDEYDAITFEMEAEWQVQGDLASVTCEFETDNIVVNLGGFFLNKTAGDYSDDYNNDFNN